MSVLPGGREAADVVLSDTSGNPLGTAAAPLPVNHSTTSLGHGHKEVTTAGTPVALAASTPAKWMTIQAYRSNTGYIAIGGSGVNASSTTGTGTGMTLGAGEAVTLPIANLSSIYLDATVNGEGVRFTYGV